MRQARFDITVAALAAGFLLTGCAGQNEPQPSQSAAAATTAAAAPVSGTYTGTQTFELGTPPSEATEIAVEITCMDAGTLSLPNGAHVKCADSGTSATAIWSLPLVPGQHSLEVRASEPAISYEVKMSYADK